MSGWSPTPGGRPGRWGAAADLTQLGPADRAPLATEPEKSCWDDGRRRLTIVTERVRPEPFVVERDDL